MPTLDTTPLAAPTGLALASVDDTGRSGGDQITSQTSALTISGQAEANALVELFDGATSLGTVSANGSGVFTKDLTLTEGSHTITARAADLAGNTGTASSALTVVVDTTPPAAPTALDLAAADDTGVSNSDNITNLTSGLTISGQSEANAVIELFDGATSLGTVTADGSGAFSLDVSLAAGTHSLTAKALDYAGNYSVASSALSVVVDTAAPTTAPTGLDLATADDSGFNAGDNLTKQTSALTISGQADANAVVELFDGATSLGTVSAGFDALVNRRANLMRYPKGASRYPVAMVAELASFRGIKYRATVDGVEREIEAMLCAVANSPAFGGGMKISPQSDITDGELEVFILHEVSRPKLLKIFPTVYAGEHVKYPEVEIFRAKSVRISNDSFPMTCDGELVGEAPFTVDVHPGGLQVYSR